WFNQDDRDVVKYLKYFTFLSHEEIDDLAEKVKTEPQKREAQRRLAEEVTKFVHGEEAMEQAEKMSKILFSGDVAQLSVDELKQAFKKVPSVEVSSE
ncbi:tyrosine--tRNA ligase, partial [Bifidobacterium pseudocatenulatum]|nr:tyrosine--tRNA ligase [Bifidobacterium pseudocatenulatum]